MTVLRTFQDSGTICYIVFQGKLSDAHRLCIRMSFSDAQTDEFSMSLLKIFLMPLIDYQSSTSIGIIMRMIHP